MSDAKDRKLRRLENELSALNKLFIKNDQELRKKMRDIRISNMSSVVAAEFTLAQRLGITMDVVLALLPKDAKAAVEQVIEERVAKLPNTTDIASSVAAKQYKKEGDDY